jgi:hypothetical protein
VSKITLATFFYGTTVWKKDVTDDYRTVALSITATLASAGIVLLVITAVSGGAPPVDPLLRFVVPMIITTLTLAVLCVLLFLRSRREKRFGRKP